MLNNNKLVYGVGFRDVEYAVTKCKTIGYVEGRRKQVWEWECPYYMKWKGVLARCYSKKYQSACPTYESCSVDSSWLYLSNFIKWVDSQPNKDWESCHLDKDFLIEDNKHYSPTTCVFINMNLNSFILNKGVARGDYLLGVRRKKGNNKFEASCSNPFKYKSQYIGMFATELEAHKAWQAKKHEYACQLSELQEDPRIVEVLRTKYAPDKDWTNK